MITYDLFERPELHIHKNDVQLVFIGVIISSRVFITISIPWVITFGILI